MNTTQWIQATAATVSIIGAVGLVSAQQSPDSGPTRIAPTPQTQGVTPMQPMPADRMLPAPRAPGATMSTVPGNDRTLDARDRQEALERDRAATDIRARDGDRRVVGERAARADRN